MDFAPLPQQRRAIEAPPGPVLVVAGPGAGKTFCLIARITHLVDTVHVAPEQRGALLNRFSRHRVQDYRLTPEDARLYREYAVWLAHRNLLDFDDLVAEAEQLLRTRSDIADAIAARWDHLLVDEFQDVNPVQYDLLRRLAAPHDNLFAVGDDEQSIFAWAGADPYVLVRFGRDYGIERPIILDKNRRCSRQIFETARRVLAQNPQLFEKQLSADQESPYEV